ncbi:MAG: SDR family oxidoreductase, partial [Tabrizicola sp.]
MADDAWHVASIARLWACGVPVDWAPIWGGKRRLRVPLPTYAFQKKPYFIQPGKAEAEAGDQAPERVAELKDWGWKPHWKPAPAAVEIDELSDTAPATWLVFADTEGLAAGVVERLRAAGHRVTTVRAGDTFAREGEGYVLSPERGREGYDLLIRDLVARGLAPQHIAHFWLVTRKESFRPGSSFLHRNMEQGFHSLTFLAQAIAGESLPGPITLHAFTTGAAQVKSERLAYPEKAMALGPIRVIPREMPGVTTGIVDLELPTKTTPAVIDRVIEDLLSPPTIAALRGERRYELSLRPAPLPAETLTLPQGAHVLITGGFGGIGLTVAEDLIRRFGVKITLIARRPLPERGLWRAYLAKNDPSDSLSRRILALQRLEALGGEVHVAQADVANVIEMTAARDAGVAAFGPVHAVIHAAGVVDDAPILTKTTASIEEVFAPKLHGTQVLHSLFHDGSIALMVLFASTSTVTGPAGQVDYVAANEYLNAYSKSRSGGKTKVVALNWGIWQGVGMAAESLADRMGRPEAPRLPIKAAMLEEASFDATGNRVFLATLSTKQWILDGHRTKDGTALIPGTGYLELAAEAWSAQGETGPFELADLTFFRALDVAADETRPLRVRLTRSEEGYAFEVQSQVTATGRKGWLTHATARL